MFNDRIPYNSTILSKVVRHNVGVVEKALSIFKELDLIDILDNGSIYLTDIQNFIGQSSSEGDRKRSYRNSIENEKLQMLESNRTKVKTNGGQMSDKYPLDIDIEIDIEKEKELDLELNIGLEKDNQIAFDIITFLNQRTNSRFNTTNEKTIKLIKSRLKEGFNRDDFKNVINKKATEWIGTDYAKYLRPETLFGNKFESYLNQITTIKNNPINTLQDLYKKYQEDEQ